MCCAGTIHNSICMYVLREPVYEYHELDEVHCAVAIYIELVQHVLSFLFD